jgi:class 3 adenylate cyclase
LRIGINLGDVIVEGDDIYGDGVNIAARIEALADAGGVFVSNTVHDHVRDRLPFVFVRRFGCHRGRLRLNFVAAHVDQVGNCTQRPGI